VINFVTLHIIEFYFHDLTISDHGAIAAAEQDALATYHRYSAALRKAASKAASR
jgi:hypothetical protein